MSKYVENNVQIYNKQYHIKISNKHFFCTERFDTKYYTKLSKMVFGSVLIVHFIIN